jgi:FkbM family methyltransferase
MKSCLDVAFVVLSCSQAATVLKLKIPARARFAAMAERFVERITGRILTSRREFDLLRAATDVLTDNTRLYKNWEINQLRKVLELLKPSIIIDVGAHHGEYAEMLFHDIGYSGVVISVEANPHAFAVLSRKSSSNPLWHVFNSAVGDRDGQTAFNIMDSTQFSSLNMPADIPTSEFDSSNRIRESVTVDLCTLSTLLQHCSSRADCSRPFLKLDTQGSDLSILKASSTIAQTMLGIQCELSIIKIYRESPDFLEVIPFLYSLGFSLNAFVPNNSGHFPILIESDAIFIGNSVLREYYGLEEFDVVRINSFGSGVMPDG